MIVSLKNLLSFLSIDKGPEEDFALMRKAFFTNALLFVSLATFTIFFFININLGKTALIVVDFVAAVLILIFILLVYKKKKVELVGHVFSYLLLISIVAIVYTQKNQNFDLVWSFAFTAFTFPILGANKGAIANGLLYAIVLPMAFLGIGEWDYGNWSHVSFLKYFLASIFFTIMCFLGECSFANANQKLMSLRAKEKAYTSKVEELSITDNLTKLFNRNKINEVLTSEENLYKRYGHSFGVIMVDIDHFKSVNDTCGHQMGDTVLKEFAGILKTHSRKTDTVGRWGGEEFLIICSETSLDGLLSHAELLRSEVSTFPFSIEEHKTASFGVALYDKDENINSMIKRADDALYNAKESGRNRVEAG